MQVLLRRWERLGPLQDFQENIATFKIAQKYIKNPKNIRFCRSIFGEGLSEPVMEFPAALGVFLKIQPERLESPCGPQTQEATKKGK